MRDTITFLSDFGLDDVFVGVCHGVIVRRAPHARLIHLSHAVAPGDVRQGATLLTRAVPYIGPAVHLAVVDPGVGTDRRGIAVSTARGDVFVGPDNGLLLPAADAAGGVVTVHELANPDHRLDAVSATFHGRDVFAPAAAAVVTGVPVNDLGPPVDEPVDLPRPQPRVDVDGAAMEAEIVLVDRFGNLQLAAEPSDAEAVGLVPGARAIVTGPHGAAGTVTVPFVSTFGELDEGALGLYVDSDGMLSLAANGASAARGLHTSRGERLTLRPAGMRTVGDDV